MKHLITRPALALAAASALFAFGAPASAEMMGYKATLNGMAEVPANTSKGMGSVDASYDDASKTLTWTVTYSDLSGPATAAHFHGPAAAGVSAPPVIPLSGNLASPIKGEAKLTDAQAAEFKGGQIYFNIHTAMHKDGELRGQVQIK